MNDESYELMQVPPERRILLLPHCLRRTETCHAKYGKWGLECGECNPECPVNNLRRAALDNGYMGVCVAPGGRLAVNYVKEMRPEAIVAVACEKELEEGIHGVQEISSKEEAAPVIAIIPLARDGCVDTEVDIEAAVEMISLGCQPEAVRGAG